MIEIRRSQERGYANHGWLEARFTFSFAEYFDPEWMHFGPLRVINQDRIQPGKGFGKHGHQDMEIVTYVLEGVLEHKDSMGNGSQIRPGEVQLMSAGTGVTHSEFNASDAQLLHLLQMWVIPSQLGTPPRYEQKRFSEEERREGLCLIASPQGERSSLTIGQDVHLYASLLGVDDTRDLELTPGRGAWLHVARGRLTVNGQELGPGDGAAIREESQLEIRGLEDSDLVLWNLPLED